MWSNNPASDPGRTRLGYSWLAVRKGDGTMTIHKVQVKKVVDRKYLESTVQSNFKCG